MQLDYYFCRKYVGQFVMMFVIIAVFVTLIDFIEQARRFPNLDFGGLMGKVGWQLPVNLVLFSPLIVLLSSIGFAIGLTRSSEMVVARAAGRSLMRNFMGPMMSAFLLSLALLGILNPLAARSHQYFQTLNDAQTAREQSVLSVGKNGVWLRQNEDEGYSIIAARQVDSRTLTFKDVTWVRYQSDHSIAEQIQARSANLGEDRVWRLFETLSWSFTDGDIELQAERAKEQQFTSQIDTEDLWEDLTSPQFISIWRMPEFIETLRTIGFSTHKHVAHFYHQLTLPVFYLSLMVLGSSLTMLHFRSNRQSLQVLIAVTLGFGLYYMRDLAYILAENNQLSALWATAAPTSAALFVAIGVLVARDGV